MEKSIEYVSVEEPSVFGQVSDLVEEAPVHDYEVRSHLMERADVLREVCETEH